MEWTDDEVRALFMEAINEDSQDSDENTGGNTGDSDDDSQSTSSAPVGAIAGGAVGGVAGLAVISALAWFFVRKHRGADHQTKAELSGSEVLPSPKPSPSSELQSNDPPTLRSELPAAWPKSAVASELDGDTRGEMECNSRAQNIVALSGLAFMRCTLPYNSLFIFSGIM